MAWRRVHLPSLPCPQVITPLSARCPLCPRGLPAMSLTSTASASASASASRTSDADHSIASGSGSGRGIVEPVFSPVVQEQLNQMRRAIIERIQREGGVHYTADFSSPLQHHHWRTIYQRYKHRTTIVPHARPASRPRLPAALPAADMARLASAPLPPRAQVCCERRR